MSDPIIRMKFDRQEGDNYYFLAGFYDDGIDLTPGIGNFPSQHTILEVIGKVPALLYGGSYVGTYYVPVNMSLKGIKGTPWIWDTDLIPDLLTNWFDVIGYLHLEWYEVLYSPDSEPLPQPYASKEPSSLTYPGIDGKYNLPRNSSQWPSSPAQYAVQRIAESVSSEGCQLMGEWFSAWAGPNEWHMITLIGTQPKLPEEPNILTRWRETHAPSTMKRADGSYDDRFPGNDFDGWNSVYSNNGKIEILQGLLGSIGDVIVTGSSGVIIPYLSPTKSGDQVSLQIPRALSSSPPEDNQAFIFPSDPVESDPSGIIAPIIAGVSILAYFLLTLGNTSIGKFFLDNYKLSALDLPGYGFAGDTHGFADDTHPGLGEEK